MLPGPRILHLDIETAPNLAFVWRLTQDYINPEHLVSTGYVLCWAAKWHGDKTVHFGSVKQDGPKGMLEKMHKLLNAADIVVHYNGKKFDIPTLNKEFVLAGMAPPNPVKQVDLLRVVKQQFKFTSNKLDHVSRELGLEAKEQHKGMAMWKECMDKSEPGHAKSWRMMERYNRQDAKMLEPLYWRLLPWIPNHPNYTLYTGDVDACPRCGSKKYTRTTTAHTTALAYALYRCDKCKGPFRGERIKGAAIRYRPVH